MMSGWGMEKGAAQPQTKVFERSEKTAGPSRPASPDTARPKAWKAAGAAPKKTEQPT